MTAPDERTETVARIIDPAAWDDSRWAGCDPPLPLGRVEDAVRAQDARKSAARHQAAAVVAALDDETARLREEWHRGQVACRTYVEEVERLERSLANARGACGDFMRSGDAARAALDRVRALRVPFDAVPAQRRHRAAAWISGYEAALREARAALHPEKGTDDE